MCYVMVCLNFIVQQYTYSKIIKSPFLMLKFLCDNPLFELHLICAEKLLLGLLKVILDT